ncbi:MAG: hypothetical protein U9O97_06400 [Elusimicrobiota bacterium]|nr:hypothetical protein [Elusimicrobiota bacterium]
MTDKNKHEPALLSKLKEDMLTEIEFLKNSLEKARSLHQEKLLEATTANIALRTEFKEREGGLLSRIRDLQTQLEKAREEYGSDKKTWEELLKNRDVEKNSLYAELAVKESEAVTGQEHDRRKFLEREENLLRQIEALEKNVSFVQRKKDDEVSRLRKEKEDLIKEHETKISVYQKNISRLEEKIGSLGDELNGAEEETSLVRGENVLRENELNNKILDLKDEIVRLKTALESERANFAAQVQLKDRDVTDVSKKYTEAEKDFNERLALSRRRAEDIRKQYEKDVEERARRIQELEESENVIRAESVLRENSLKDEWSVRLAKKEHDLKEIERKSETLEAQLDAARKAASENIRLKEDEIFSLSKQIEKDKADFRIALEAKTRELEAVSAQDAEQIRFLKGRLEEEKKTFEKRMSEEEERFIRIADEKERVAQTLLLKERELEELTRELNSQRGGFVSKIEDLKVSAERARVLLAGREEEYKKEIAVREEGIRGLSEKINEVNSDWSRRLKFAEEEIFAKQKEKFNEIEDLKTANRREENELSEKFNARINELTEFKAVFESQSRELAKALEEKENDIEGFRKVLAEKEAVIQAAAKIKETEIASVRHKFEDEIFSARRQFESERERFLQELGKKEDEKNKVSARSERQVAVIDAALKAKEAELGFADTRMKEREASLSSEIKSREIEISGLKLEISKLQEKLRLQLESFSREAERSGQTYLQQLKLKDSAVSEERLKLLAEIENKEKQLQEIRIQTETSVKELNGIIAVKDRKISQIISSYENDKAVFAKKREEEILEFKSSLSAAVSEKNSLEIKINNREDVLRGFKDVSAEKEKQLKEFFETEKQELLNKIGGKEEDIAALRIRISEIERRRKNEIESKTLEFLRERDRLREEINKYYNKFTEAGEQLRKIESVVKKANNEKEVIAIEWRKRLSERESELAKASEKINSLEKQLVEESVRMEKLQVKENALNERENRIAASEHFAKDELLRTKEAFAAEKENLKNNLDNLRTASAEKEEHIRKLKSEEKLMNNRFADMKASYDVFSEKITQARFDAEKRALEIENLKKTIQNRDELHEKQQRAADAELAARESALRDDFKFRISQISLAKDSLDSELANARTLLEREKNSREDERIRHESMFDRKLAEFDRKQDGWNSERKELLDKFYLTDATRKELIMEIESLEKELKESKKGILKKIFS